MTPYIIGIGEVAFANWISEMKKCGMFLIMLQINYGLIIGANEESMNEGKQRVVNKLIDLLLLGKPPKILNIWTLD